MEAGKLRHRVNVRRPLQETDASGAPASAEIDPAKWTFVANAWSEVRTLTGRDLELAQQVHAEATHNVIMRYPSGKLVQVGDMLLTDRRFPNMYVLWSGDKEGRGIQTDILAKATTPGAA